MTESNKNANKPGKMTKFKGQVPKPKTTQKEVLSEMSELAAAKKLERAQETVEADANPVTPPTFQYHVCVVASIKGDNIFTDALVNVPKPVESAEDINALRNAMAQSVGALPERVTIVTFQLVLVVHA